MVELHIENSLQGNPRQFDDRETVLDDSYLNKTPVYRRKPIMDGKFPQVMERFGGRGTRREELERSPRWRERKYSDDYLEPRRERRDGTRDRRGRDPYDDRSLGRRDRKYSRDRYDDHSLHRRGGRGARRESAYSDDDLTLRRAKGRRQSEEQADRRRSRRESAFSDDDLPKRRGKARENRGRDYNDGPDRRRRTKKHGPTSIDDFDESVFESDTESDSYSSDSDSDDSSGSEQGRRGRFRSSASASEITNATWALGEGDQDKIDDRIKTQRGEVKRQLASLAELQKTHGVKALSPDLQKTLQGDLQKLEILQAKRKEKPGDLTSQMQLLGQQMLLCEHLKEAQAEVTRNAQAALMSPSGITHSRSAQNIKLHMLQEQQQVLAQQIFVEQQRQIEAEQQRQLFLAAEQQMQEAQRQMAIAEHQRQLQLAQIAQYQGQQHFQLAGMPVTYSPYGGAVAYF